MAISTMLSMQSYPRAGYNNGNIYVIGGRSFLASLVSTAPPTAKRGGVAAVQIHTGHVQERPVTA